MKTAHDIVLKPVITENSMAGIADKKYTFKVATDATKVEIANMLTVHIDYVKLCHCSFPPYAFTLLARVTMVPLEPGTAPLTAIRLFSVSTLTTVRFCTVTRTKPM